MLAPAKINWPQFTGFLPLLQHLARMLVILVGAYIATRLVRGSMPTVHRRIVEFMRRRRRRSDIELDKRTATLGGIFLNTSMTLIWIVAVVMVLQEAGFNIGPILAGAGVVGLAIGFGAQNLVRDVFTGLFLLLENQIRINDVAVINGTGGLVEQINLRTIVLRGEDGTVHIFPNGSINSLSNMTHDYSYYVFNIAVAYKEDVDRVCGVLKEIGDGMLQDDKFRPMILEPLEIMGVDKFAESSVIIKARIKTQPIMQWAVGREMNRRIKKKFDQLGIEIPYPQTSVHFGETSKPFAIRTEHDREEIRALISEVLEERSRRFMNSSGSERRQTPRSH